jgi:hypothetical protein
LRKTRRTISQNIATKSKQDERKCSGYLIGGATYGSHLAQQVMYLRNLEIILFCQQQQAA